MTCLGFRVIGYSAGADDDPGFDLVEVASVRFLAASNAVHTARTLLDLRGYVGQNARAYL